MRIISQAARRKAAADLEGFAHTRRGLGRPAHLVRRPPSTPPHELPKLVQNEAFWAVWTVKLKKLHLEPIILRLAAEK